MHSTVSRVTLDFELVGDKGLEPSTSRSQTARASQLRQSPNRHYYNLSSFVFPLVCSRRPRPPSKLGYSPQRADTIFLWRRVRLLCGRAGLSRGCRRLKEFTSWLRANFHGIIKLMKYVSIFATIVLIWVAIILMAITRKSPHDIFELYIAAIVSTVALFLIGFTKR